MELLVVARGAEKCAEEPEEHGIRAAEHGRVIILVDGTKPLCGACAIEWLQGRAS